jgi:hypothetical protein
MKISISLLEQASAGRTHMSRSGSVSTPLWAIKGRVYSLEKGPTSWITRTQVQARFHPRLSQSIQYQSGRRVLRSGGPNHSKSSCPSCVHLSTDRALLSLLQTHP